MGKGRSKTNGAKVSEGRSLVIPIPVWESAPTGAGYGRQARVQGREAVAALGCNAGERGNEEKAMSLKRNRNEAQHRARGPALTTPSQTFQFHYA